ncbi:MAG: alpha/beta fold hydrolase [Niabella sp.]
MKKFKERLALAGARAELNMISLFSKRKTAERAFDVFCTTFGNRQYSLNKQYEEAEHLSFRYDGLLVKGYRWNKGAGKRLLVAHGYSSHAINFSHFVSAFVEKGYEVVAFDAPGHGYSEGKRINALIYTGFVQELIKHYGRFDVFFGHSFGGLAIGLTVAELADNADVKMVLIAPAANTARLFPIYFDRMHIRNKQVRGYFDDIIMEMSGRPTEWFSLQRCLPQIKGPVLWIHDEEDDVTPVVDAHEIEQQHFPNVRFIFTKGLGHRKIYRSPEVMHAVLDFV